MVERSTFRDPFSFNPDDYKVFLDFLLETFGEDRLIFGSDWPVIRNNRIRATAGGHPIHLDGAGEYAQVIGNRIEDSTIASPNAAIYAEDGWESSSFVGNVTASTDVISYKTGLSNVNAGNVGTVTVRP